VVEEEEEEEDSDPQKDQFRPNIKPE